MRSIICKQPLKHGLVALFLLVWYCSRATHNRAGEIIYKRIEPFSKKVGDQTVPIYHYSITVIKYTDHDNDVSVIDRCVDTVDFGDGETGVAIRINKGVANCACFDAGLPNLGCGQVIVNENGHVVKLNIYTITHYYPGPGNYLIRSFDRNRNTGVINIPNSVNVPFYLESLLIINTFSGANSSPRFSFPPTDQGCLGQCFEHDPGAFDPDPQDSLSFALTTPRGENGLPIPGYTNPPGDYTINKLTGELRWCSPLKVGEYNMAFIVYEWRKNTNGEYQLAGYVLRDMQVIVEVCDRQSPPQVSVPPEICAVAGELVQATLHVSDPDGQRVTLTGGGGPFEGAPPLATLTNSESTTGTGGFDASFAWQTSCGHIRNLPYQVSLKVQDDGFPVRQVSFSSFQIRVVPPAVAGFTARPMGSNIRLTWNLPSCNPATNPIQSYLVYRRDRCEAGSFPCVAFPEKMGYELIATVHPDSLFFTDDNNGKGLVIGQTYQYALQALYNDGVRSAAGTAVCGELRRDVPLPLHVDVRQTDTEDGSIFVNWMRPLKTEGNFDSLAFPGPYTFKLLHRSHDGSFFSEVYNTSAQYLFQLDTSFLHQSLNTVAGSHDYKVEFLANGQSLGYSQTAGSPFLKAEGEDRKVRLTWSAVTPWVNHQYEVYRKGPTEPAFQLIGHSAASSFTDSAGVSNGHNYCYRIKTMGQYSDPKIPGPLFNSSQDICVIPKDLTPPCTPTLYLEADCPLGHVKVAWTDVVSTCSGSDDLLKYILYRKSTVNSEFIKVAEGDFTHFEFEGLNYISGCYAVQAIDTNGNSSRLSAEFCIDNCPVFVLPNVFTPNQDGVNDHFKAVQVRQIKKISLFVLDRWGNEVYRTEDPFFLWDGVSRATGRPCSEGAFYYVCEVFEQRLSGEIKRVLKGHVQLSR